MPRDTQIFLGAAHAGNSDYLLPKSSEIVVEAVTATFTDNGASADWCPAVVMISDSGHTIARAMLPDVKVTAGDDAEASFFPGVKPGAAATPSGGSTVIAYGQNGSVQTVPHGTNTTATFADARTSDSSVLSWSTVTHTNDRLTLHTPATLYVVASVYWTATASSCGIYLAQGGGAVGMRHGSWQTDAFPFNPSPFDGFATQMDQAVWSAGAGFHFSLELTNSAGFDTGPSNTYLFVIANVGPTV